MIEISKQVQTRLEEMFHKARNRRKQEIESDDFEIPSSEWMDEAALNYMERSLELLAYYSEENEALTKSLTRGGKIRDLLTSEAKWTKEALCRDNQVEYMEEVNDVFATYWSLSGALLRCYYHRDHDKGESYELCKQRYDDIEHKVAVRLGSRGEPGSKEDLETIRKWNDAPERTFTDVKALVEELDI